MKFRKTLASLLLLSLLTAAAAVSVSAEEPEPAAGQEEMFAEEGAYEEKAFADEDVPAEEEVSEEETVYEDVFAEWNEDAPALQTLIDYVYTVTDEASPDYIPEEDRVAVFDMDGTLYGELFPTYLEYYMFVWRVLADPSFEPDEEMTAVAEEIRECGRAHSYAEDMAIRHAAQAARAYAGMTLDEFSDFVTEILLRDVDGFEGMTYGEAFYLPMVEVVDFLRENDFKIYVCSGSDRFICRTLMEGILDIPSENVIGMDVAVEATGQNDTDGLDYVFAGDDEVIRTDRLLIKNLKMNKVAQIVRDIGRQPVLSFGNSSGDVSMHNYTISNNPYLSAAFMLVADDDVRDYGNPEKARELREKWEANGYNVISMKNDFRTIYGDDVVRTDSFRWEEELGAPEEETSEEAGAAEDVQYVMYLGTNDQDTNQPVFTPEEAKEKVKEVLIRRFGGYTIQEASGGWIDDDGNEFEEYTLVICLSDTTEEQVHDAADELLSLFNQSSVLIQTNPTKTEFYSGE